MQQYYTLEKTANGHGARKLNKTAAGWEPDGHLYQHAFDEVRGGLRPQTLAEAAALCADWNAELGLTEAHAALVAPNDQLLLFK